MKAWLGGIGIAWTIAVALVGYNVGLFEDIEYDNWLGVLVLLIPSALLGWIPAALADFNEPEKRSIESRIDRAKAYIHALEEHGDNDNIVWLGGDPRQTYKVPIGSTFANALLALIWCCFGIAILIALIMLPWAIWSAVKQWGIQSVLLTILMFFVPLLLISLFGWFFDIKNRILKRRK